MANKYIGKSLAEIKEMLTGLENNSKEMLQAVKANGLALQFGSEAIRENLDIARAAILENAMALEHVSEHGEKDYFAKYMSLVVLAYSCNPDSFKYVKIPNINKKELAESAKSLRDEIGFKGLPLPAIEKKIKDGNLKRDPEKMMQAVKARGLALQYGSESIQANVEIALAAVKQNGLALKYVGKNIQSNSEILIAAYKQNPGSLADAGINEIIQKSVVKSANTTWSSINEKAAKNIEPKEPSMLQKFIQAVADVFKNLFSKSDSNNSSEYVVISGEEFDIDAVHDQVDGDEESVFNTESPLSAERLHGSVSEEQQEDSVVDNSPALQDSATESKGGNENNTEDDEGEGEGDNISSHETLGN